MLKKKKKKRWCLLDRATEQGRGTAEGSATSQQVPGCELNQMPTPQADALRSASKAGVLFT